MAYPRLVAAAGHVIHQIFHMCPGFPIVSTMVQAKRGKYLEDAIEIASLLLTEKDDMVQNGYGWLLKEACRVHQQEGYSGT